MKYKWLNKENNSKIIVFFNGWGMDECIVRHLNTEDYDVLMFYDYNTLDTKFSIDKNYSECNIISWSMGVMIASIISSKISLDNIKSNVAINGTLKPIDAKYGIHPKIYDLTINSFNQECRNKFIENMFEKKDVEISINRTIENQKSELIALKTYTGDLNFKPNKILISDNDKIIPTKNQAEFWGIKPNLKSGHCPFFNLTKWSELL